MQGQNDDINSLEDDHAPKSTPEKVEFQVGNYCLVNYEEELWHSQITKIISSSLIRVKCYDKADKAIKIPKQNRDKLESLHFRSAEQDRKLAD